ncbi:cytochrome P450 6B5-like [Cydia pomonella]|uniref:cytochrome P450 6B5-like n=1 Tax=Cydia pomonella TaxID=82600 RepID=UPI002ADE1E6F|nr:cytochrome P450 6B5-like [Cydia pomonella]
MLVVLAICIVAVSLFYHHFAKYNNYWKERNVAGPEPTFFFGNIKDLALKRRSAIEVYTDIYDKYPNEKVLGIFRMRSPTLLVKDVEIIKHILIKDFENFTDRDVDFAEEGIDANLFSFNGNTWRALRQHCTSIFTSRKLKNMMYLITERGDKLIDYIEKISKEQPDQEVHGIVRKYTQGCITSCAFGLDIDTFDSKFDIFEKLEPKIFSTNYRLELEMMYPGILKRLKLSIGSQEVSDFFFRLTKDVISQRNGNPSDRNDFVDLMLSLRKAKQISFPVKGTDAETTVDITDDIMAGMMFIFYAAGYQTSALTMSYILHYLARNPGIQEKVVTEIKQVLKKNEGKLTYEAVSNLKYMGQVFDETLRLHPVTDHLRRRALNDYRVPGTDLTVKKGQIFIIPIPAVHMDPNNYPDPTVFDPDRFSPENVASRHSCAYLSFGLGPRHCIGWRFAQLQSRVGLVKLLSTFRVEPCSQSLKKFQYQTSFLMTPKGGVKLNFTKRLH